MSSANAFRSSGSRARLPILCLLVLASIASTSYLYLYPVFHGCAFPVPESSSRESFIHTLRHHAPEPLHKFLPLTVVGDENTTTLDDSALTDVPFRLLVFGDPQLEGDSSITAIRSVTTSAVQDLGDHVQNSNLTILERLADVPSLTVEIGKAVVWDSFAPFRRLRKHIDLLGNDFYLGHIYRTMLWWSKPTHVTVLGDLLGSQWVSDVEFEKRTQRFWERVFAGALRVPDNITFAEPGQKEELRETELWRRRLINIAGNHDIGYAGDMTPHRVERFEEAFGSVNWDITFTLPSQHNGSEQKPPSLRLVILNSMNLDTPALNWTLQEGTYNWTNAMIRNLSYVEDDSAALMLLTHLPLFKPSGVCVDAPMFRFYPPEKDNVLKEQNHLSDDASKMILASIFGFGGSNKETYRKGIILNGHDHEGCDVWHSLDVPGSHEESPEKDHFTHRRMGNASISADDMRPGIREITQRSMMGEFGGYAGLLSVTYKHSNVSGKDGEWEFRYQSCALGIQHIWWAVHILDFVTIGAISASFFL